ncbi:MAG: class IV adenylate cyclase [Bacilli bacterium]|nr:class IV adenylate cyclase [Bacilli bacterium]
MKFKIETEMKYFCMEPEKLISIATKNSYKELSRNIESDEYFTDIDSVFIKDRTCLRIRKKKNKKMEVTFKGKSSAKTGSYCKLENNINMEINEYDNFVMFLSSLGYYSYVIVEKERLTLTKIVNDLAYNIMIDRLQGIGGFVEFEIISDNNTYTKEELNSKLNTFVQEFNMIKLTEVNQPYRDIVANNIYAKSLSNINNKNLYFDIDDSLCNYEKDFYHKYKDKIKIEKRINLKWGYYKKNQSKDFEDTIRPYVQEFINDLILDDNQLIVLFKLLKKINYKAFLLTKINRLFLELLFKKLGIRVDVLYKDNETNRNVLIRNNIDIKKINIIKERDIKSIISLLLIITNNE